MMNEKDLDLLRSYMKSADFDCNSFDQLMALVRMIESRSNGNHWFSITTNQCIMTIEERDADGSFKRRADGSFVPTRSISKGYRMHAVEDPMKQAILDVCITYLKMKTD